MDDMVGVRFHPSEKEIISYYLARKLRGLDFPVHVINEVDINLLEPWDLPDFSEIQSDDPVWYFFYVPDYMDGGRTRINRKTKAGFWKATGKDRPVKDKHGREIGTKKTLVFHTGRSPNGVLTNWAMQEFHYKDATKLFPTPFVLCRLKRKSNDSRSDGHEEPSPPSASTSGNPNAVDIVSLVNHEPLDDLLSLDHDSLLELQQLLLQPEQQLSCSTESLYEPDTSRFQLDIREQEEADFVNSLWATDEVNLRDETVHTRRHGINPVETLSGVFLEDSSDSNVKASIELQGAFLPFSTKQGAFVETPRLPIAKPKEWEKPKAPEKPREPGGSRHFQAQSSGLPIFKKGETALSDEEILKRAQIRRKTSPKLQPDGSNGRSREHAFIFLETPLSSHTRDPPSVYIVNIVVALLLFLVFVREMVYLH